MSGVIALVLAAGASRRLGRPKALVQLASGETLLARAVRVARETDLTVYVTVSPDAVDVSAEAERIGALSVPVSDAAAGMSASLRRGVAVAQGQDADAVVVLLVDQWQVDSGDITRLLSAWNNDPLRVVASSYAGTLGAPAVFGRAHFDRLSRLEGDAGARNFLRDPSNDVRSIDVPHAAADVDSIADANALSPKASVGSRSPDA